MTHQNLEDLKSNHPSVHAKAEELSVQMRNKVIRANMKREIQIEVEHVMKEFAVVTDPDYKQQTYFCVESSVMASPFYIGKTQATLYENQEEFETARDDWKNRKDSEQAH